MLRINSNLSIPDDQLNFNFIRASGPGGQNINKVSSAVQLQFNIIASQLFNKSIKDRLIKLAGNKVTHQGMVIIVAKRFRSQERNRQDAENRLIALIRKALIDPKKRIHTHPSKASKIKRLEAKKQKGTIKCLRQSIG